MLVVVRVEQVKFFLFRFGRPHAFNEVDVRRVVHVFDDRTVSAREFVDQLDLWRVQQVLRG